MRQVCQVARINLFVQLCCSHDKFVYNSRMSTNGPNDETPRTTYPIPAEMIEDAFEGDDVTEGDDSDIDPPFDYSAPEDDSDPYADDHKGYDHPEFDD